VTGFPLRFRGGPDHVRGGAKVLAARLDLDLDDTPICLACLSFVTLPLGAGDLREARNSARRMSFDIWHEGLEQPAIRAMLRAQDEGTPDAEAGLADVDERGGRSLMAQAIVWHLAGDLAARAEGDLLKMGFQRVPPPES
jgi:hypothetical protein